MSEQVTSQVTMGDRVRERPDLVVAATQAADYLSSCIRGVPPPERIRWEITPSDPTNIELAMSDSPTFETAVSRRIPITSLRDPAQRNIWIQRVWGDLLDERSRASRARLDELMRQYAREYNDALELASPDA